MNRWFVLAAVWLLVMLQVAVLAPIRPFGVVPQLLLVGVLFVAAYRSLPLTLAAALWGSWWLTVFSPIPFSGWLILYPVAAVLLLVIVRSGLEVTKLSGLVIALGAATIMLHTVALGAFSIGSSELLFGHSALKVMALETGMTVALAWLARPLLQSVIRPVN